MFRIKKNKPVVAPEARTFRAVRRLNINRTYTPLKIGAITSMFGILVGAILRLVGL